jgi:signal transduction histidine kinase
MSPAGVHRSHGGHLELLPGGVMKTVSRSSRKPRGGYIGLALTLSASLTLGDAASRLQLVPGSRFATGVIAACALVSMICGLLLAIRALRAGREPAEAAHHPLAVARPRGGEEAAALAHAQKMEALGLLAGGVAHDFNNQLHVIRNSLAILQRQDPPADAHRYLEMIRRSADQAAALTGQLLAFSRRQPLERRPIDPNGLVTELAELLRHSLGERISVATALGRGVCNVSADAGQLETALLNLAINARDAMSHAGRLTIETANAMPDDSVGPVRGQRTRQYVMIAVSDTGSGMSPEVAARACEPFFTTKAPGRGTGLGLSQVAGFAHRSGGDVRISSRPGQGTTVRLYLPGSRRIEAPEGEAKVVKRPASPIREATRGTALAVGADLER